MDKFRIFVKLFLSGGPGEVDLALVVEFLGQVVESLEASEFGDEPLFVSLLARFQSLPR